MLEAGVGRPDHLARVLAQMGEDAGGFPEKTVQPALVGFLVVAPVPYAEIAAADGLFHEFPCRLGIPRAK